MHTHRRMPPLLAGLLGAMLMIACTTLLPGRVARLEAEDGQLYGVEVSTARGGFTGRGYVTGFDRDDDRLELTFQAASGLCELRIRYCSPRGDKGYSVAVNGTTGSGVFAKTGESFAVQSAGKFVLRDGQNSLILRKGWGWFDIDSFELVPAAVAPPAPVPAVLSDPAATPAARRLHAYLVELYGRKTLAGQQDFENLAWIQKQTGREPAVAALDFMDYSPSRVEHGAKPRGATEKAVAWVRAGGGILTYCWHWNAPADLLDQPGGQEWYKGFYTKATTFDIAAVLADPAGERYRLLLRDIDAIAAELRKFADADIPILWRPLHEAQGGWFWWGAKGPEPLVQLWHLLYRRLTRHHGLHNLIWVYSPPSGGISASAWYPGDEWVDIVAPDIYAGRRPSMSAEWESAQVAYGGRKLVALGEGGDPPDPELMRTFQTRWSWFATWGGAFIRDASAEHLRKVFLDEDVITRDELPAWTKPSPQPDPASAPGLRRTYRNPIINYGGAADPTVLLYEGTYYLYPTTDSRGYDVFVSSDLVHWERKPKCFRDLRGGVWAPDVYHHAEDGKIYLYYTANDPDRRPRGKLVGVAVADHPLGPFEDKGVLVKGAIDAHLFRDDDGSLYLYYVMLPGGFQNFVQPMADPLTPKGEPKLILQPSEGWERRHGHVTEGPWMLKRNGVYYYMYSGSGANGPDYAIGYATATSPTGPFTKHPGNPIAQRGNGIFGPGHHCTAKGPDGRLWLIYHQKNTTKVDWDRFVTIDPLWFDDKGIIHIRLSRGTDEPAP